MRRIAWLSAAVVLLLLGAVGIMLLPGASQDAAGRHVLAAVEAFNERKFADSASHVAPEVALVYAGTRTVYTRETLESRMAGVADRFAYMRVRPATVTTEYPDENTAVVRMEFHWTVSSPMYPGARRRSEIENSGAPDVAVFTMSREGESWQIEDVTLDIMGQR